MDQKDMMLLELQKKIEELTQDAYKNDHAKSLEISHIAEENKLRENELKDLKIKYSDNQKVLDEQLINIEKLKQTETDLQTKLKEA